MAWVASPLSILQLPNHSSRHDVVPTLSTTKPKLTLSEPSSFTTTTLTLTLTLTFFPPQNFPQNSNSNFNRSLTVRSHLNFPLISPQDHWGIWTAIFATSAFGLWSEKTKIGSMVSAALVSTLVGLGASNMGIIPYEASAYSIVLQFLLPLTVP
ncbi:hypothetical protein HYC85_001215 [Camellia sinensis]|uniref:Uncharacterized protein n=1 Tax=Camellia sinensis TaxID=4442 RepID=A0A7J7I677_CAMSI|nr:hypothetical protein HYC85_001215 [Camellia sinensis]